MAKHPSATKKQASTLLIGAHMSIAGGYYKAIDAAGALGMKTCQLFTKNNNQWNAKPITEEEATAFRGSVSQHGIVSPISHTSYLINLATPNEELWSKSVAALAEEWRRAEQLHLTGLVLHPGSATDGDEAAGIQRIQRAIRQAHDEAKPQAAKLLLENTAGQGTSLGWNIGQLAAMIHGLGSPKYLGICLDTCHAHVAGYDLSSQAGLDRLVEELQTHRLDRCLYAIHLNDSKKGAGSRVDRHEHLGSGTITEGGLARFINHPLFRQLPMYLETEKGSDPSGADWDAVNMAFAQRLYR